MRTLEDTDGMSVCPFCGKLGDMLYAHDTTQRHGQLQDRYVIEHLCDNGTRANDTLMRVRTDWNDTLEECKEQWNTRLGGMF